MNKNNLIFAAFTAVVTIIAIVCFMFVRGVIGINIPTAQGKKLSHDPTDATALCRDGMYSFSQTARGTCSGRGGVKEWLND